MEGGCWGGQAGRDRSAGDRQGRPSRAGKGGGWGENRHLPAAAVLKADEKMLPAPALLLPEQVPRDPRASSARPKMSRKQMSFPNGPSAFSAR